jgi:hypothetical protein
MADDTKRSDSARLELKEPALWSGMDAEYFVLAIRFIDHLLRTIDPQELPDYLREVLRAYETAEKESKALPLTGVVRLPKNPTDQEVLAAVKSDTEMLERLSLEKYETDRRKVMEILKGYMKDILDNHSNEPPLRNAPPSGPQRSYARAA